MATKWLPMPINDHQWLLMDTNGYYTCKRSRPNINILWLLNSYQWLLMATNGSQYITPF
ncbi:hypothetical protein [Chlorogloea sp. CCALA 695]|uniref:hypothetical protein n=1 Tax=Chlorogloea sp. CCALA 695 TaxID=2107693 RepID=UPI0013050575|nr:hypothetical protein [Chlorogloea sp. CCALA 695]